MRSTRWFLIGITKDGEWLLVESVDAIRFGEWKNGRVRSVLSPDAEMKAVLLIYGDDVMTVQLDVVFPVLHGLYGEDGTIQGNCSSWQDIPYVGLRRARFRCFHG